MNLIPNAIPDVKIIEPNVFGDERRFFFESFNHARLESGLSSQVSPPQDVDGGGSAAWNDVNVACLAYNDPDIGIQWPIQGKPSVSAKDQQAKALVEAEHLA